MKHSLVKYLEDMRLSIEDIEAYMKDVTSFSMLLKNKMLFDAVCRRFAVIGEALYQADKMDKPLEITSSNKIKGLRHIIVHDYDLIRPDQIWLIIQNHLPQLKLEVLDLISKQANL